nr:hypothetical protein [Tanacetum cinerariifolium]
MIQMYLYVSIEWHARILRSESIVILGMPHTHVHIVKPNIGKLKEQLDAHPNLIRNSPRVAVREREYNLPTAYEVAALVSGDGNPTECRDVIVKEHHTNDGHNPVKRISELHPSFMALQYPLLFPYGEDGFQLEIPLNDAMAICRWAGPPNLFVKMTCNPKWFEIERDVENYIPGQPTADRPDTITCVFMMKLDNLMEDIQKGHHFGRVKADDKISSNDEIDHVIFAELPSEVDDLIGFKAVRTHMMHGPCGDQFRSSPYMSRNGCTKGYPKEYCEETFIICDGWPCYKRSNNERRAKVGQRDTMLDNRFVIPHNINLIVKYDCHINVEWCNQGSLVKYLFNYLNKGPDHVTFVIEGQTNHNNYNNNSRTPYRSILHHADEIEQYLNYRYISACEACWKLLGFELHYRSIAVERLAFHKEGCNRVYFRDDDDVENVFKRATNAMSKFTGWMRANEIYPEGRHLLYADYPTEFTWHASDKEWRPRIDLSPLKGYTTWTKNGLGLPLWKTYLWKTIIAWILLMGKIILSIASYGIASLLLPGGRTAHSRFRIPLELDNESCCGIDVVSNLACLIREASLIIWDEAPLRHRHAFEAVDRTFRDICKHDNPNAENEVFGGKVVVLGGDFRQILPVIPNAPRAVVVASTINKSSAIWDNCRLLSMRDGTLHSVAIDNEDEATWVEIPDDLLLPTCDNPIEAIVSSTFLNLPNRIHEMHYLKERCILCPTNDIVDSINTNVLQSMPGEMHVLHSADIICSTTENLEEIQTMYPTEFLNTLKFSGVPNHNLELKVGAPVILLRNTGFQRGSHIGEKVFIGRIDMTPTDSSWPFRFIRRQFPIKVCFAMTVNKSQGQTFNHVCAYLEKPVFTHGQLYVVSSRVTSRDGLRFYIDNGVYCANNLTQNIVYKELTSNNHEQPLSIFQRSSIHAKIPLKQINKFKDRVKEGCVYKIHNFTMLDYDRIILRPLDHKFFVEFCFTTTTEPSQIQPKLFDRYVFAFVPFGSLTDHVIGVL